MDAIIYVCVAIGMIVALTVSLIAAKNNTKGVTAAHHPKKEGPVVTIDDAVQYLELTNLE